MSVNSAEERALIRDRIARTNARPHDFVSEPLLIGELTLVRIAGKEKKEGGYGKYPVLVIKRDAEDLTEGQAPYVACHAFHFLLGEQLQELKPKKGERLAFQWGGKLETNASAKAVEAGTVDDADRTFYHMWTVLRVADLLTTEEEDSDPLPWES